MIKKVVAIKGYPPFIDFKPTAELPEFSKYNLIYGWNGSGKTSFSRLLRTFELGHLEEPERQPEYKFALDNGSFIDQSNLLAFRHIRVFNRDFIEDSVFCDNGPKPIFFLGKESKEDKEKIIQSEADLALLEKDRLSKEILFNKAKESKEKSLSNTAREIKISLTTARNDNYRNYEKPNVENAINELSKNNIPVEDQTLSTDKITNIKKSILQTSKPVIGLLQVPNYDISTLIKEVGDVVSKKVVSQVIEQLKSDEHIGKWVEEGLAIHKQKALKECAFCNQKIPVARIAELEEHFNDEYQRTLQCLQDIRVKCEQRKVKLYLPDSSNLYDDLSDLYLTEKSNAENVNNGYNSNLDILISIIDEKRRNLFLQSTIKDLALVDPSPIARINDIIIRHNAKTDNYEDQINKDKKQLEIHFIAEYWPTYKSLTTDCDTAEKEYSGISSIVKEKESEIKKLKEDLISHHIPAQNINKDLEAFLGRGDIQIKATDAQEGYQITRNGETARNLCEGEKNALAIVYFLTKMKEDGYDLKNGVVVIDDPVSSLDSSAIFQAFSFIKEALKDAGQIFILTHNYDYFRQVRNWFKYLKEKNTRLFMMTCSTDSGIRKASIVKLDRLLTDYESEYHFLFSVLYNIAENNDRELEKIYPIPNIARKFLDSFLAFRIPKQGNIYSKLDLVNYDAVKKTRIHRFVETHSHPRYESGMQDFDISILSETPSIVKDLIDLVKVEDERHYTYLVESISQTK